MNKNNDAMVKVNVQRIDAMQKYVTNSKTEIPVGGAVLKPADVIAVFQEDADNRKEVTVTKAAYSAAVAKRTASEVKRQVTDEALKGWVLNRFGETSAEAKEFGYAPRKRAAVTAEQRANAVKQALSTREARGTLGPKARLSVKGPRPSEAGPSAAPPSAAPSAPSAPVVPAVVVAPAAAPVVAPSGGSTVSALNAPAHS